MIKEFYDIKPFEERVTLWGHKGGATPAERLINSNNNSSLSLASNSRGKAGPKENGSFGSDLTNEVISSDFSARLHSLEQLHEVEKQKYMGMMLLIDGIYQKVGFWSFIKLMIIPACVIAMFCYAFVLGSIWLLGGI